jgi:CO/xanthine dehydrogenase FAD-binding subunit
VTPFTYLRPDRVEDIVHLLEAHGPSAQLLAGGTDVLVRLRHGHARPSVVIDLKRAKDLDAVIVHDGSHVRVGARVVMDDLVKSRIIQKHFPALVAAARVVGSVQIRYRATLAGNICNASPAADTAPALLAYGAIVNIVGPAGDRAVPLEKFFVGPGKTVLQRGELVSSLDVAVPGPQTGSAFSRLTRRRGVDLATLTVSCLVRPSGEARIALGAVAPTPVLVECDDGAIAVERIVGHASPISDVRASRDYRAAMLPVFIRRTLQAAEQLKRAKSGS